jgi:hypothetical protein
MKRTTLLLLLLYTANFISAQQNLGIRNSNYAGIQSACLNPSAIADSKLKWDINVFSTNTVFDNTFLFIPRDSLHILGFKSIINDIIHQTQFFTHFDPQHPDKLYNVTLSNELLGPSFMINTSNKSAIGLITAARFYTNINDITGHFAQNAFAFLQQQDLWNKTFHDSTARLNTMGWLEYGINYARVIYKDERNELKGGVTLKYLQGIAAAYFKNTNLNYNVTNVAQFAFTNSSIDYGRTDYNTLLNPNGNQHFIHGNGLGANIGFTYLRLNNFSDRDETNGENENNYVYRIGVSLIDAGSINFNKYSAAYHLEADTANYTNWKVNHIYNNTQLDRTLSAVFYNNDSLKSLQADHFRMKLPAAISFQFDWNFYKNFFVNATIVKGFTHDDKQGVIRPDVYSLTPRYETRSFEVSVPFSLLYYGHLQPRLGVAARVGCFFFGGDALGGLLKLNDFEGADFYAGIHVFVTKKHKKLTLY